VFEQIKCDIAINGDSRSVITKKPVSIPEVVVLRHIHGDDSVTNISVIGQWDHDDEGERDRLGKMFGDARIIEIFNQYGELPKSFQDARIEDVLLDPLFKQQMESKPAPKPKTKAKKAKKAES
tara:strand:- start:81 stop:449 length:369 start_codon:yes stop_codon:yes gene_type:complete